MERRDTAEVVHLDSQRRPRRVAADAALDALADALEENEQLRAALGARADNRFAGLITWFGLGAAVGLAANPTVIPLIERIWP